MDSEAGTVRRRSRLRSGDRISIAGALLMVLALVPPWFSVRVVAPDVPGVVRESTGVGVYTALDGLDVLFTAVAVGLILLFGAIGLGLVDPSLRVVALVGAATGLAIAALRIIRPPGADASGISVSPSYGVILAAVGAIVVIAGQVIGGGRPAPRRRAGPSD